MAKPVYALVNGVWTLVGSTTAHAHTVADVTGLQAAIDAKADIASPTFTGTLTADVVKITGGTPGVGKVLTSDADGDATWEAPSGVGALANLSDVDVSGAIAGDVLVYPEEYVWVGAPATATGDNDYCTAMDAWDGDQNAMQIGGQWIDFTATFSAAVTVDRVAFHHSAPGSSTVYSFQASYDGTVWFDVMTPLLKNDTATGAITTLPSPITARYWRFNAQGWGGVFVNMYRYVGGTWVPLSLGNAATRNVGTTAGTVAAGDDSRISGSIQQTLFDAKGDLLVATAADTAARLPVGANGQVLTADSSAANGVKWASAGSLTVTGGIITTAGGYRYHTFSTDGTFSVSGGDLVGVELLIVAGGGGGGGHSGTTAGGGGGGGGLINLTYTTIPIGNHAVTVGLGGITSTVSSNPSSRSGTSSSFGSFGTAIGGGGGGYATEGLDGSGAPGGSGGGSNSDMFGSQPGSATAGQGYAGGQGTGNTWRKGGGGGGAGGVGLNFDGTWGQGGAGVTWNGTVYAAGGFGGRDDGTPAGSPSPANTGKGGDWGQAGSNGVVIVRYPEVLAPLPPNWVDGYLIDAKGDLIAGSAADTAARLPVGANGQVLTADSAEATGMKWATPAEGVTTLAALSDVSVGSVVDGNLLGYTTGATWIGLPDTVTAQSGSNPEYAWDNNSGTAWSLPGAGRWIVAQYVTPKRATRVTIDADLGGYDDNLVTLEGSDDGSSWTTIRNDCVYGGGIQTRDFAGPVTYAYWRLTFAPYDVVRDIKLWEVANQWVPVTAPAAPVPVTVVDAKGDLVVGTADNTVARLAAGANNQMLIADSGETTGLKWVDQPSSYVPVFYQSGILMPGVGTNRWYNDTSKTIDIVALRASVEVAPVGDDIDINYLVDDVIEASLTITAGTTTSGKVANAIAIAPNSYVTIDIVTVGSTTPGTGLGITSTVS